MASLRINVSLPRETVEELNRSVHSRKRSAFISRAINDALREERARRLAAEYAEAAAEIRGINQEMEGAVSDGID